MSAGFVVLDPLCGGLSGRLFQISANGVVENDVVVGYSPEVRYHPHTRELLVLESDAGVNPMTYFLRLLDPDTLQEKVRREIPTRPMYAGFPGRSVAGPISASSRYVYFLRSGPVIRYEDDDLAFRLTPARWDRELDEIEIAQFHVDSCHVDYGIAGTGEEDLFLHLSCEYASTVAFGSFFSPDCNLVRFEELARRQHGPLETNGSWFDAARGLLYCVNRDGAIYEVNVRDQSFRTLAQLRLRDDRSVPVHQICGAAGQIHVGVAEDIGNMGLGRVTEIWSVSASTGELEHRRLLQRPVMNFVVTPDGEQLLGADPYSRSVFCMDRASGEEIWNVRGLGRSPSEIIVLD